MNILSFAHAGHTHATCTLNGKEIDCAELADKAQPYLGLGIGLAVTFLVLLLASFVFWLLMLLHALQHDWPDKTVWVVLLAVSFFFGFGLIVALVYFFAEKKNAEIGTPKPKQSSSKKTTNKK